MESEARLCYHAVPRIMPNSFNTEKSPNLEDNVDFIQVLIEF